MEVANSNADDLVLKLNNILIKLIISQWYEKLLESESKESFVENIKSLVKSICKFCPGTALIHYGTIVLIAEDKKFKSFGISEGDVDKILKDEFKSLGISDGEIDQVFKILSDRL